MKKLAFLTLLAIAALISSCGSNTIQPTPISSASGNWQAQLFGGIPPAAGLSFLINFDFNTTNGNAAGPITVHDFTFLNANACFASSGAPSPVPFGVRGTAQLNNNINAGQITGSMTLTVTGQSPSGQTVLTLTADPPSGGVLGTASSNGTMSNGAVSGTWTMTNPGSSTNGCSTTNTSAPPTFIMCQNATTCSTQ
jgi:hypothetical protein